MHTWSSVVLQRSLPTMLSMWQSLPSLSLKLPQRSTTPLPTSLSRSESVSTHCSIVIAGEGISYIAVSVVVGSKRGWPLIVYTETTLCFQWLLQCSNDIEHVHFHCNECVQCMHQLVLHGAGLMTQTHRTHNRQFMLAYTTSMYEQDSLCRKPKCGEKYNTRDGEVVELHKQD